MKKSLTDIFYSFPIQLFILHFRNNLLLVLPWLFVFLLMTGSIVQIFGIKFLFLAPEYMGAVNFWSFFFLGLSFGGFLMTWNLTTYLLDAHMFPFLASLARPFTKFCLNNMIVPLIFIGVYLPYSFYLQKNQEYFTTGDIIINLLGFLIGGGLLLLVSAVYFYYTNKDILNFLKIRNQTPPNLGKNIAPGRRVPKLESVIETGESGWRVDTYLTESLKPRLVRSVAHYDSSILESVFRQNHVNALIVQLFGLVLLVTLGYSIENAFFRIPAAASMFILLSVFTAITGAITYWFMKWRVTVFVLLLIVINFLTSYDIFNHKNKAYGLDYKGDLAPYNYDALYQMCEEEIVVEDKKNTIKILEKWKDKAQTNQLQKPKMIVLCVSGGGMKASVWTMQVIQQVDSIMQGGLLNNTVLITGASGGMIGTAYLRELYLHQQMGQPVNIHDRKYIHNISKDLLNSITFTIVSNDLFLPWVKFETGGHTYKKDRGYIFEKQLDENTNFVMNKRLVDYKKPEEEAIIPMLFVTSSIVNDGRRLIMSPQGISYMTMAPIGIDEPNTVETDAVDFGRLFKEQGADSLRFLTALRMNATYPYILPDVYLPSEPSIEAMDAGFRDNFGVMSATRFIHVFKDWIEENTSGVVLVQISGTDKLQKIEPSDNEGVIESIFNPLGIAGQILTLQDFEHDTNLGYIFDLLGRDKFDVIRFIYQPQSEEERASMTFHLTKKERNDILESFKKEDNQESLTRLLDAMRHQPTALGN